MLRMYMISVGNLVHACCTAPEGGLASYSGNINIPPPLWFSLCILYLRQAMNTITDYNSFLSLNHSHTSSRGSGFQTLTYSVDGFWLKPPSTRIQTQPQLYECQRCMKLHLPFAALSSFKAQTFVIDIEKSKETSWRLTFDSSLETATSDLWCKCSNF